MSGEPHRFGSYSTARVSRGRVERLERHVRRIRRDAERLGLPPPDPRRTEEAFLLAAAEAFPGQDGIVRVEWSRLASDENAEPRLIPSTRGLGRDPKVWRARIATTVHPGPELRHNTKSIELDAIRDARTEMQAFDVDEMLLFDADGLLVEGAHSTPLLVDDSGQLVTPALELGGVEGLGLEVLRESAYPPREARLTRQAVLSARELMAVNCVRGVIPIIQLDDVEYEPGEFALKLGRPDRDAST